METEQTETELKPQDMISGEWYVIDCGVGEWLEKFKELVGNKIYSYHSFDLDCFKYSKSGLHIGYSEGDKIRKATRKEVLEYFPDEFQEEKKEVESEEEVYFYSIDHINYSTSDLQDALNDADNGTIIYKATPIGTKQTKSFLEPIKTKQ
jgi:molybdopterin converting factor small subunit